MARGRVLVVDDEPMFGEFVRTVCKELDHKVMVTTESEAFQEAYESFDPTIIVLDVVMPAVDGIEILQWLVKRKSTAKILVVTGYNPKYGRIARLLGDSQGLDVHSLTKPVRVADLRAALASD